MSMSREELVWTSGLELARMIRAKEISPLAVAEAFLDRIAAVDPRLGAYCLVTAEVARAAAREAEIAVMKGEPLGPLHGVPISVKDVIYTRGIRTTGGSRLFAQTIPTEDALVFARLKASGAVLLGKTNTSEFGHKALTDNPLFGVTRNPWNLDRTPGGSTGGGAAAVASGLGPLALGTDGGGSLRIPASFCGVFGFKPSYGRVPQYPGFPGWDRVSHVGPITRTVRDAAAMLDVIAGDDARDRESLPNESGTYVEACEAGIDGLHVAWTPDLGAYRVDPTVRALCEDAAAEFESLGCYVEVVMPDWESPEADFSTMIAAQFHAAWGEELERNEALMDPTLAKLIRRGAEVTARQYLHAVGRVEQFWLEVRRFLERFDLLLTPTVAVPPFAADAPAPREVDGERVSVLGWMPFTYPFNLTGQPAASVPAGWTDDGLPVGLQVVGQRRADRTVLAACAAWEATRPWSDRRPAL
jgi:aspartyl-tRNA(Asn)/glutamyl-tRNA(Gln) amidotransferase subunit A